MAENAGSSVMPLFAVVVFVDTVTPVVVVEALEPDSPNALGSEVLLPVAIAVGTEDPSVVIIVVVEVDGLPLGLFGFELLKEL